MLVPFSRRVLAENRLAGKLKEDGGGEVSKLHCKKPAATRNACRRAKTETINFVSLLLHGMEGSPSGEKTEEGGCKGTKPRLSERFLDN